MVNHLTNALTTPWNTHPRLRESGGHFVIRPIGSAFPRASAGVSANSIGTTNEEKANASQDSSESWTSHGKSQHHRSLKSDEDCTSQGHAGLIDNKVVCDVGG